MKDLVERAAWTFVETFIAVLLVDSANWVNLATVKVAAISGIAAGLSVVKTYAKERIG